MEEKKENYFIDFLRFIFSICIVIYHGRQFALDESNAFLLSGNLGVDFYFIVTGFLMMNTISKTSEAKLFKNFFSFIYRKIKKIVPGMIVACVIGAVLVYKKYVFLDFIWVFSQMLTELLQLGLFGFTYFINCSWWYISVMIFVLLILYPLANKYREKYCYFIAPIIIFITLFFVYYKNININSPLALSTPLINGFYKGLIFIPLGNIAFVITKIINKYKDKIKKSLICILSILEIAIYVILLLNLHFQFMFNSSFAYLLTLNVALTFSGITYTSKIFKNDFWRKLGKYGFYLYLCNTSVRVFFLNKYAVGEVSYPVLLFKFLFLTCIIGFIIYCLIEILYKNLKNKKTN